MTSATIEWIARRRAENNMNNYITNSLPVPSTKERTEYPRWKRVVALAGRLACIDDRYTEFARATGVEVGMLEPAQKKTMIAELDAVVAHLFGLSRDELELMFEDFPATEAGVSPGRRAAILEHYAEWAS